MDTLPKHLLDHLPAFTAFARKRLASPELAADAVQESLLRAIQTDAPLRQSASAQAWFYRILRRTIIDIHRKQSARQRAEEQLAFASNEEAGPEDERLVCACLHTLVPLLRPAYAEVIARVDLRGESQKAVADELGVSLNALKVRLHRARARLKQDLQAACGVCADHGCLDCSCQDHSREEA